jgi:putative Holliday junction resolvase
VEKLVIGISENEMAEKTQAFIDQLRQVLQMPIEVTDETLSSHTVATQLKEAKAKLSQRQKPIDDRAAAVFLQDYLDSVPR